MTTQTRRWHVFPDADALQREAVRRIGEIAESALSRRNGFYIVLAGGTTPRLIYEALAGTAQQWSQWHVFFGDERCLPADHADRNSVMADQAWLQHVPIPETHIHPIPAERGPTEGALAYAQELRGVSDFDLVLLGLGEDGHTASLFPGQDWGASLTSPDVLPVWDAPKPPPERISLSAQRLARAREVLYLVTGASKQEAVARWKHGEVLPAGAIAPPGGVDIFVDPDAS